LTGEKGPLNGQIPQDGAAHPENRPFQWFFRLLARPGRKRQGYFYKAAVAAASLHKMKPAFALIS
jgi:hypothetical protein